MLYVYIFWHFLKYDWYSINYLSYRNIMIITVTVTIEENSHQKSIWTTARVLKYKWMFIFFAFAKFLCTLEIDHKKFNMKFSIFVQNVTCNRLSIVTHNGANVTPKIRKGLSKENIFMNCSSSLIGHYQCNILIIASF